MSSRPHIPSPLLRCPATHRTGFRVTATEAFCEPSARAYPIDEGVADFAPDWGRGASLSQRLMETRIYSRFYETLFRPALTRLATRQRVEESVRLSLAMLELEAGQQVLDVACGTGNFTRPIAEAVGPEGAVFGLDVSWPMLRRAETFRSEHGLARVWYVRADATHIPFVDATMDRVHCAGALHLMPRPAQVLSECARVLAPEGRLVLATFVRSRAPLGRRLQSLSEQATGFHWFTVEELYRGLAAASLEVREEIVEGTAIQLVAVRGGD